MLISKISGYSIISGQQKGHHLCFSIVNNKLDFFRSDVS